jgi:hypothetical protein
MTSRTRALLAFVACATAGASPAAAQTGPAAAGSAARVRGYIEYLAADAREGRGIGTAGLDSAAAYVARAFASIGLGAGGTEGYFQPFAIDPTAAAAAHAGVGGAAVRNVVGVLPGRGALAGQAVVVGAHYDHLGMGGFGSLDPDSAGVVHNGADDNASGTAALLETAALLTGRGAANARTIVFVAFTAEEIGLVGSSHYVAHPVVPNDSTIAMINFDMVGRLRDGTLLAIGTGSARELEAAVDSIASAYALDLKITGDPWGRSDHSSFYGAEVPVVHFFTDTHEDYHRTTDDAGAINVPGVVQVATLAADLAWALATRDAPLTYVSVPPPAASQGGGYGAYLGTIPDMSESPGGVRLTGVRAGSPAEQAGLQRGDVLIQIGDTEIANLYDMTDALRAHRPGDVVKLVYLREGERVEATATLGTRGG